MANIRYIGNDTLKLEKGKVHSKEGNKTGCGAIINDNPKDWEATTKAISCNKRGCK